MVHYLATWFLIHAFETLSILQHIEFVDVYRNIGIKTISQTPIKYATVMQDIVFWISVFGSIGYLLGLVISFGISFHRKWFWFNSLLVFLLFLLLSFLNINIWAVTKQVFLLPGALFIKAKVEFLVNGSFLLTMALLLFYQRRVIRFIENGNRIKATVSS